MLFYHFIYCSLILNIYCSIHRSIHPSIYLYYHISVILLLLSLCLPIDPSFCPLFYCSIVLSFYWFTLLLCSSVVLSFFPPVDHALVPSVHRAVVLSVVPSFCVSLDRFIQLPIYLQFYHSLYRPVPSIVSTYVPIYHSLCCSISLSLYVTKLVTVEDRGWRGQQ